jgi:hypothetical protein
MLQVSELPTPPRQLVRVHQLARMVPAYEGREGPIRWALFNRKNNGLEKSGAVVQRGRTILIDPERWFKWLAREGAAS